MMNENETIEKFSFAIDLLGDYFIRLSIVEFPFLGLPVIYQIYSYIVKKIVSRIEKEGELKISFAFIDRDVSIRKEEYNLAIEELKQVINSETSQEIKNEALNNAKNRIRDLIRFPIK